MSTVLLPDQAVAVMPVEQGTSTPVDHRAASSSTTQTVLRGALALFSTQPVTWASSLITAMLVPRYLGDLGLGQSAVAWTIANIAGTIAACGVPFYLTRRVATQPGRPAAVGSAAVALVVGLSLIAGLGLALIWPLLGIPLAQSFVLPIAMAGMVVAAPQMVLQSLLVGQERHARYAWLGAATVAGTTGASIAVLVAGGGVIAYMATGVVTSAVMMVWGWHNSGFRLRRKDIQPRAMWELTRGGFPFLGWELVLRVYGEVDKILLGVLTSEAVVGWYFAAYRIIAIPVFIPTLITTPLLPALSRSAADPQIFRDTLRRSLWAVLVMATPAAAGIIAIAPAVPNLLGWPEPFKRSVPLMMILAVHQPVVAVDMVLATGLIALRGEGRWFRVGVLAAFFNIGLNLFLIPMAARMWDNGAIGAAIVTVGTEFLMFTSAIILMPRGVLGRETLWVAARVLLACVALIAVAWALLPIWLPAAIVGGALTYGAAILALRVVRPSELWTMRGMVRAAMVRPTAA